MENVRTSLEGYPGKLLETVWVEFFVFHKCPGKLLKTSNKNVILLEKSTDEKLRIFSLNWLKIVEMGNTKRYYVPKMVLCSWAIWGGYLILTVTFWVLAVAISIIRWSLLPTVGACPDKCPNKTTFPCCVLPFQRNPNMPFWFLSISSLLVSGSLLFL